MNSYLILDLKNGAFVEAVIMRYDTRLGMCGGKPRPGGVRSTLCISSQVLIFFHFRVSLNHCGASYISGLSIGWLQNGLYVLCNW